MKSRLIIILVILAILFSSCEKLFFADNIKKDKISTFEYLWNEVNNKYAFLEYKRIDWDSIYNVYRPLVNDEMSDDSLFIILKNMMNELKDGHVNIVSKFDISRYDISLLGPQNIDVRLIKEDYLKSDYQSTGGFYHNFIHDKQIGYIYYPSFSSSLISDFELDYILNKYSDTKGLIIDIRQNGGGYVNNVFKLLSAFTLSETKLYETQVKTGPGKNDFSLLEEVLISPRKGEKYTKKLAILTSRGSYSASSFFAVSSYAYDNIFLVGDTTGGGLGLPNGGQLPNGWTYRFSITRTIAVDGKNYENGVPPNYTVILNNNARETGIDNVIEFAVNKLIN